MSGLEIYWVIMEIFGDIQRYSDILSDHGDIDDIQTYWVIREIFRDIGDIE